eukprot:Seg8403.2 transcript_id=Seg8403.2/GoldUCD/mRNA.D3Y31 product="hypothetical protein" protein_id=Seg8403.2/GoldUCD/D3Y31
MSQSAKQIADSLRGDFKEISAKNCEVSLLMEEIDSKSKEISVLKDNVKMSQKAAGKLDALEKKNEFLRNELSKSTNNVEQVQQSYHKHQADVESLSLSNKNLVEEIIMLKSENVSVKRLNEMLSSHSDFIKDQIICKDKVINALVGHNKAPTLSNNVEAQAKQNVCNTRDNKVLIMGDSIIKLVEPDKFLSRNPEIKVTKDTSYTWEEAIEAVSEPALLIPNNIVLHIGTNDIRDGKPIDPSCKRLRRQHSWSLKGIKRQKYLLAQ